MLDISIITHGGYTSTGDESKSDSELKEYDKCSNTITFDAENLIVTSTHGKGYSATQVCAVLIDITPELINELKTFVSALEAHWTPL